MQAFSTSVTISVAAATGTQKPRAKQLAADLGLDLVTPHRAPPGYLLLVCTQGLELRASGRPPRHGPIFVDFTSGRAAYRRAFGGGRGQVLARAVGIKVGFTPSIIDATAGFGRDAFALAALGCQVHMIERCKAIAQLLQDGLQRARQTPDTHAIAARVHLHGGEALDVIPALATRARADVIYLDPMYPARGKSAAVKKEMQVLQALVGKADDNAALLRCALCHAGKRVVVKRPVHAPAIEGETPHGCIKSPNTRYDLYLPESAGQKTSAANGKAHDADGIISVHVAADVEESIRGMSEQ